MNRRYTVNGINVVKDVFARHKYRLAGNYTVSRAALQCEK
jgi:hypothetical protein